MCSTIRSDYVDYYPKPEHTNSFNSSLWTAAIIVLIIVIWNNRGSYSSPAPAPAPASDRELINGEKKSNTGSERNSESIHTQTPHAELLKIYRFIVERTPDEDEMQSTVGDNEMDAFVRLKSEQETCRDWIENNAKFGLVDIARTQAAMALGIDVKIIALTPWLPVVAMLRIQKMVNICKECAVTQNNKKCR